jgi:hypothetical protein
MGGTNREQSGMFSYISAERRAPKDSLVAAGVLDAALRKLSSQFVALYAQSGRPSIAPEKLCARCCCRCCTQ